MLKILTFGVYDMLHIGHILLFKRIKEHFPDMEYNLIVGQVVNHTPIEKCNNILHDYYEYGYKRNNR